MYLSYNNYVKGNNVATVNFRKFSPSNESDHTTALSSATQKHHLLAMKTLGLIELFLEF